MTSLLRDLALEGEDFSEQVFSSQQGLSRQEGLGSGPEGVEERYEALKEAYESLEVAQKKSEGEASILRDRIGVLEEDVEEKQRHLERQCEQEAEFQEVEETNADLREECERHVTALKELQECHSDLESSLSDSNNRIHILQMEKKFLQESVKNKDEIIAKLERELCDVDKAKINKTNTSKSQIERSLSSFGSEGNQSNDSVDSGDAAIRNLDELSLEDQVHDLKECVRRSSSRLSYLNTRLTAKDDTILKLQSRIEEVITERDSFREALQMSFVNSDNLSPESPVVRSSSESALSSTSSSKGVLTPCEDNDSGDKVKLTVSLPNSPERHKSDSSLGLTETKSSPPSADFPEKKVCSPTENSPGSVLGNWQNTVAAATGLTTDGLKGVTSSLGSYLSSGGGGSQGVSQNGLSPHHKHYISNLEKKVQLLHQKNKKMSELKALIPVVEELKEKLQVAEDSAKETDKWADEEFSTLSKKVDEMRQLRKEAVTRFQHSQQEVEDLKQQISRTANTYANFEEKIQEKNRRIHIVENELKTARENSVDVSVHQEAQDRISALMGESKHWQQKAQSLSKEMHRSMSVQMDYNKKKDEILKLEKKIEELEVERMSFKEAMQELMLDQSNTALNTTSQQQPTTDYQGKATTTLAKSWLSNIL